MPWPGQRVPDDPTGLRRDHGWGAAELPQRLRAQEQQVSGTEERQSEVSGGQGGENDREARGGRSTPEQRSGRDPAHGAEAGVPLLETVVRQGRARHSAVLACREALHPAVGVHSRRL
ncbi:hypothetical protein RFN57_04995 [Streptomyces violaceochromogenes]|uniref:Uncharacterized protein n=1 Tax=Streptomyces violaceochromogenes TaxID=67377 RepID=A0ABU6LQL7_9ACTN|nr:hypothetical protein [Streptomyces violaceochromogenes]MEC7051642.1 hypothetical protein [Streptomyces violaceochromogenes]GHC89723.1 hypothetical protein GCM10010309_71080 [Streptomyces violaceochromogenes]